MKQFGIAMVMPLIFLVAGIYLVIHDHEWAGLLMILSAVAFTPSWKGKDD